MGVWTKIERLIDSLAELLGRIGWLIVIYSPIRLTDVILRYF